MRIKLDENIPASVKVALAALGHDVDTVNDELLTGQPDGDVWAAAQKAQRFFVTQDMDFSDARMFPPGSHHGLLLLRIRNPGRQAIIDKLNSLFNNEEVSNWGGCIVAVTDMKVRVRGPR
ncbi:MAG TPA: DUF5615 family PIN-like protein [Planctomycetota bacterium]|nr:DUF5615 family PIN-like protein [Planctomycetota bacterium]